MKKLLGRTKICSPIILLTLTLTISCVRKNAPPKPKNDIYLKIPDINFETELIKQGIDSDGVINQQILKSDAEAIKRLDLNLSSNFGDITDLTGIEGFVNLTFLSAARQKLNYIDLRSNTKLDTLFLHGNRLTHIDISNNLNLVLLDVQSNELSVINGLSKLISLKQANLSFNNFEEISVENESIEVLMISHNLLKTIDLVDALNLKNVLLTLNQLTTVDFHSNTLLETLVISGNKLQNINLEKNSSLTHLYCSSNSITELDVSKNQELIDLRVDRNPQLTCIKILNGQEIPTVKLSDYQELNSFCN